MCVCMMKFLPVPRASAMYDMILEKREISQNDDDIVKVTSRKSNSN